MEYYTRTKKRHTRRITRSAETWVGLSKQFRVFCAIALVGEVGVAIYSDSTWIGLGAAVGGLLGWLLALTLIAPNGYHLTLTKGKGVPPPRRWYEVGGLGFLLGAWAGGSMVWQLEFQNSTAAIVLILMALTAVFIAGGRLKKLRDLWK